MIRYAVNEDKPEIIDLFNICFPGEEGFARWFFDKVYDFTNTIVYEVDGKVIASIQMLPVALSDKDREYSSYYLFAVGTLPQYRGKGIMARLIDYTFEENHKKGTDCAILIVQEPSLLDYYSRFGFEKFFSVSKISGDAKKSDVEFRTMSRDDVEAVDRIYRENCVGKLFAIRDKKHYDRLLDMYGETAFVQLDKGAVKGYTFGYFTEDMFVAAEIMGENISDFAEAVAIKHNKKGYKCVMPGNDDYIGMIKGITCSVKGIEGYINLLYN